MQMNIRVTASGALFTGKAPEIVQKKLEEAIVSATGLLHREVVARTPSGVSVAQGGLLGSIKHKVTGEGTPMVKGVVGTAQKYAEVVEKGRRPGKGVPRDVLIPWIMEKLGIKDEKGIARANFFIRRKIRQKGFEGAHMFEKALDENWNQIQAIFNRAGLHIARELSE